MKHNDFYSVEQLDQIEVLTSQVRQEIVDSVDALGPSSVRELAVHLGYAADSLYYHVRKLVACGLLVERASRRVGRKMEAVFDVPGPGMRLRYDPSNAANAEAVTRVIASMLRVAERDFESGFKPELAVVEGEGRNLWGSRGKMWLTEEDLAEVNQLLGRLESIGQRSRKAHGAGLYALTWVLAPVEAKPPRRSSR